MPRYFAATAMGGRLYVRGVVDWGKWDPRELVYLEERVLERTLTIIDRRIETAEELAEVIKNTPGLPAVTVWIREGLEEEARKLWEPRQTAIDTFTHAHDLGPAAEAFEEEFSKWGDDNRGTDES